MVALLESAATRLGQPAGAEQDLVEDMVAGSGSRCRSGGCGRRRGHGSRRGRGILCRGVGAEGEEAQSGRSPLERRSRTSTPERRQGKDEAQGERPLIALLATVGVLAGQCLLFEAFDGGGQAEQARLRRRQAEVLAAG